MKQILVELKQKEDLFGQIENIVKCWKSGKYRHLLLHIYSGMEAVEFTEYMAKILCVILPEATIVGTTSAGEILDGHVIEKGVMISAAFFESTNVNLLRFDNVRGNEKEVGQQIREKLDSIPDIKAAELVLPGTEIETKALYDEIDKCSKDIKMFGGYSGGHAMNSPVHYVFDAKGIMYDAVLVTSFAGKDFYIDIDKVIGWEPLGVPFIVTKADGHRLVELNNRPASEIYERFLQIDRNLQDNAQEGYTFPLRAEYKGDQWLRSAIHIEEDGSLNMHGYVMEGMEIQLSYGNPETIVKKINERLEKIRKFKPQAIWIYSCIVRKAFWDEYVDLELTPYGKLCSTSGFYTWGELIRNGESGEIVEHNVTQLSIAMREGEAEARELPEVKVDDSVLKGPVAQLRRLTSMVYTTMEELQQAHRDLNILNKKLMTIAERDALTGLYNRGKTEEIIRTCLEDSSNNNTSVSLIMADIDHFKAVNDNYGHQTGDSVLKEMAGILSETAKEYPDGKAGRWGGEEFFIVLPHIEEKEAMEIAETLRKRTEEHVFAEVGHITASIGVITVCGYVDSKEMFLSVDNALYHAKEGGRNRVVRAVFD